MSKMTVRQVSAEDYHKRFPVAAHVFNSVPFVLLNETKVSEVCFLLVEDDGRCRFGLIVGDRGDMLASPFSAPYGGLEFSREERLTNVITAIDAIAEYAAERKKSLRITMPPSFHRPEMNMKITATLLNRREALLWADYNYHYDLSRFPEFERYLAGNARRNFHTALRSDFRFEKLGTGDSDIERAYNVIRKNHESFGYPLRMSLDAVIDTARILPADFFMLTLDGTDVAAAQIYHVAPGIVQLINWGDIPSCRPLRPMNFMAWKVMEHYYRAGELIYDLGPASENGVPAPGLCDFKAGLGCCLTMKYSFCL